MLTIGTKVKVITPGDWFNGKEGIIVEKKCDGWDYRIYFPNIPYGDNDFKCQGFNKSELEIVIDDKIPLGVAEAIINGTI